MDLDRFCKDEIFEVSEGIKTSFIRPAGRKDVTVSIKGIKFNTPDGLIIEYLNKHGEVVSNEVIYEKFKDGPFKGKMNGIRKYQVDFSKGNRLNLVSFHLINRAKVSIRYPGQKRTCGRCHKTSQFCEGNGVAQTCEENRGERVSLVDEMKKHWDNINFQPTT